MQLQSICDAYQFRLRFLHRLAGSDTTAISLRAVFYYIIKDKRVYQTLQREIDEAHKLGKLSPVITYAESLQLEYLYVSSMKRLSAWLLMTDK